MRDKISAEYLNGLSPMTFMDDEKVAIRFIELADKVGNKEPAEFHHQQATYLKRLISDNQKLRECTVFSLYCAFIDVALDGLSLDRNMNLCYIEPSNVNIGTRDQPVWEKRAVRKISPYGELAQRIDFGHLKHVNNVVIVYECDKWAIRTDDNANTIVVFEARIPREKDSRIIGSWVKLTRPDDSYDIFYMLEEDIERLKRYSANKNQGKANALYASGAAGIDTGFLKAKTLKHAFKSMPKVPLRGTSSELEDDGENFSDVPEQENNVPSASGPGEWTATPSNTDQQPTKPAQAPEPAKAKPNPALDF